MMSTGTIEIFEGAIRWLQHRYTDFRFFAERDIVWTVQERIAREIASSDSPYRVFNDHTIWGGTRADLVILDGDSIEVAAEFKYEPSHARRADRGGDIWPSKLDPSVVCWGSVERDVQRVREYVEQGNVNAAFSIFVDEGGHFRYRDPHPGSEWIDWGRNVSILWSKVSRG